MMGLGLYNKIKNIMKEFLKISSNWYIFAGGAGGIDFSLVCKYCDGSYVAPSKPALRKHVSRFHRDQHIRFSKSSADPLVNCYQCKDCSYRGPSDGALRQHRFRNHKDASVKNVLSDSTL